MELHCKETKVAMKILKQKFLLLSSTKRLILQELNEKS